jgi:hypothetical protein
MKLVFLLLIVAAAVHATTLKTAGVDCRCNAHLVKPVCSADGQRYINSCVAKCFNAKIVPCKNVNNKDPNPAVLSDLSLSIKGPCALCRTQCFEQNCEEMCKPFCSSVSCVCPKIYKPVCDKDGKEYANSCIAECNGQTNLKPCDKTLQDESNTVPCATCRKSCNGNVACTAKCEKVCVSTPCVCPRLYAPVCTKDGRRFTNSCLAKCAGETEYTRCAPKPTQTVRKAKHVDCVENRYKPVCTASGTMYVNECVALKHNETIVECKPDVQVSLQDNVMRRVRFQPESSSECLLKCVKQDKQKFSVCIPKCIGRPKKTESKEALQDVVTINVPTSKPRCICVAVHQPICNKQGKVYGNACMAKCSGEETENLVPCPTKKVEQMDESSSNILA